MHAMKMNTVGGPKWITLKIIFATVKPTATDFSISF